MYSIYILQSTVDTVTCLYMSSLYATLKTVVITNFSVYYFCRETFITRCFINTGPDLCFFPAGCECSIVTTTHMKQKI